MEWIYQNWYAVGLIVVGFSSLVWLLVEDVDDMEQLTLVPLMCGVVWPAVLVFLLAVLVAKAIKRFGLKS